MHLLGQLLHELGEVGGRQAGQVGHPRAVLLDRPVEPTQRRCR